MRCVSWRKDYRCCVVLCIVSVCRLFFFFFNDTATTEIYTLSLHDALPISIPGGISSLASVSKPGWCKGAMRSEEHTSELQSHSFISYAVFCLKKKTIS